MRILSRVTRTQKSLASAAVLVVAVAIPVVVAALNQGFPVSEVQLDTKTVWVTNGQRLMTGRLDRQIDELDAGVATNAATSDVVQNGETVFSYDPVGATLQRVDTAYETLVQKASIPVGANVVLGGETLAVLDPADGRLWVLDAAAPLAFDPASTKPVATLGSGAAVTVTTAGTVFAVSTTKHQLAEIDGPAQPASFRDFAVSGTVQLSAVGQRPVALLQGGGELLFGDGTRVRLPSTGLRLQQPGAAATDAAVASASGLLLAPLDGGAVRTVAAQQTGTASPAAAESADTVAAPAVLDGCDYGAWGAAQRYLQLCKGGAAVRLAIPQNVDGKLAFRVNRHVIVLNDLADGNVWLANKTLTLVNNWSQLLQSQQTETATGSQQVSTESVEDTLAKRTQVNNPPIAQDDDFGVRPERTTVLPILDNDTDPDGDVLTATSDETLPANEGKLDVIEGGRAFQYTSAPGQSGSISFRYTADDGRGGTADANVTVRIVPYSIDNPPVEQRVTSVSVELGGTSEFNALSDWKDPDGDAMLLTAAAPTSADLVRFTPDGHVTFQSRSGELGPKTVELTVSDGQKTQTGTIVFDVKAPGTLQPVGTPDFATAFVGEQVVVHPTDNDVSPDGNGPPTLTGISDVPAGLDAQLNTQQGTVTLESQQAGVYYLDYGIEADSETGTGLIRVDVVANPTKPQPPIAVADTAYLRAGEPTNIMVLDNDVSPSGAVLAIQSIDTSGLAAGVTAQVVNNTYVRVTTTSVLTQQTQFTYRISNGSQQAQAGVTVIPVPPVVDRQPPIAEDDETKVRAGDVTSVDVLANDTSPDQEQLFLDTQLVDTSNGGGGLAFVQDGKLRYQAPTTPGQYSVVYRVRDQFGESATAKAIFDVTAPDRKDDSPPDPTPQVARAYAGSTITINLPLYGVDPDGDSVVVTGISAAPTLGTITGFTPDSVTYVANRTASGTDTFEYVVEDGYGLKGIGKVSVGVIQPPDVAAPPTAVDDTVSIRPGRVATVPVLLNDSDPRGLPLKVSSHLTEVAKGISARVVNNQVMITAPQTVGTYSLRYTITNTAGGSDSAYVLVKVTPDAPLLPPTAEDIYLSDQQVKDPSNIVVDPITTATDPGGDLDGLQITLAGANASHGQVLPGGKIKITQADTRIQIAYTLTDPVTKLSATAFIVVPPATGANFTPPPYLNPAYAQQTIPMNGQKEWKLSDIVVVPSGKPAILTSRSKVVAADSDGTPLAVDAQTIRFAPAANFRGQTTINFEVTDGSSATDPNGHVALLSMQLEIGNPDFTDVPPSFTQQSVQVVPGEAATTVDLRAATSHPNPAVIQQVGYDSLTGATAEIQAQLNGSTLSISAPVDAPKGTTTTLGVTLHSNSFSVPGRITVTVVASNRPLVQTVEDDVKAQRAVPVTTNVLSNDVNPFADQGRPMTLVGASVENVSQTTAQLSWSPDGTVTVTPDASFIGNVSVVYTVEDATKDPAREVQGRLIVTVRDVPDQPQAPTATPGDGSVTVGWSPPATNGEPIQSYTIRLASGGALVNTVTVPMNTASYTFTGLSNGQSYTANVTAANMLGSGRTSASSAAAVPFGTPAAPSQPSVTASTNGSGSLSFTWGAAGGNGRSVDSYTWHVDSGSTEVASGTTSGLSASWTGTVGTSYTVHVTAHNAAGDGAASPSSGAAAPTPGPVSGVSLTITSDTDTSGNATLNASYGSAAANGANPSYECDNSNVPNCSGPNWSRSFGGVASTTYALRVRACVGSVCGVSSGASATTRATPQPAPTSWSASIPNPPRNSCPENSSSSDHYSSSGPSCSSAHGWATGNITVYCYVDWSSGDWYLFSGSGYAKSEGWYVTSRYLDINGSPPHC